MRKRQSFKSVGPRGASEVLIMDRVPESVKRNRRTHQEAQAQLVQQVDWEREAGSGKRNSSLSLRFHQG